MTRVRLMRPWNVVGMIVAGLMVLGGSAWSQQPPSKAAAPADKLPTFSSDVKVVNVLATVRDKSGKVINDLGQTDFVLEEDGHPQTIRYFSRESDLPLTLGLLVDTSRSMRLAIEQERSASATFVDRTLREEKDSAFLIHFDREVELLQDLTRNTARMDSALQKLQLASGDYAANGGGQQRPPDDSTGTSGDDQTSQGQGRQRGQGGQGRPRMQRAGTLLYDSVFLAADEVTKKQTGRKALIVLSDGVDRGSKTTLERSIRSAQQADTLVYTVYFAGEQNNDRGAGQQRPGGQNGPWGGPGGRGGGIGLPRFPGGGGYPGGQGGGGGRGQRTEEPKVDGKKILERMAKETGGRMFEASKKQPVEKIYQQIEDDLRHQYSLGYTPDRASEEGVYHRIKLTTRKDNLSVQARDGYYATGK